jgi:uncharacterized membrane protein
MPCEGETGRPCLLGRRKGGGVELHEWLLFFHILGSIIWVGGAIVVNAMTTRANRSPDRAAVFRLTGELEWVGPVLIGPSSLVVIALGIWLVLIEEWAAFSQAWIVLSLVLVGVSSVLGFGYFRTEGKAIARRLEERGSEDPEVRRRMRRLLWVSRIDALILVVVLWAMVFKPGV